MRIGKLRNNTARQVNLAGPVKKVYLGVLFWCTSEKGVLILTLNGEKGVLFFFNQNKMLLPK